MAAPLVGLLAPTVARVAGQAFTRKGAMARATGQTLMEEEKQLEGEDLGKTELPESVYEEDLDTSVPVSEYRQILDQKGLITSWQKQNENPPKDTKVGDPVREAIRQQAVKLNLDPTTKKVTNTDQLMEFRKKVDEIEPYSIQEKVPELLSSKAIISSLDSKQRKNPIIGLDAKIETGEEVKSRFDIKSYTRYGAYHATLRGKKDGKDTLLGYAPSVYLKDVDLSDVDSALSLKISQRAITKKGQREIKEGKKTEAKADRQAKTPFITMKGKYIDHDPRKLKAYAERVFDNPEWSQLSVNPAKAGTFVRVYKEDGVTKSVPVTGADEVIQIGKMVLAKGVKDYPGGWEEYYKAGNFNEGGDVKDQTEKMLKMQEGGLLQEGGTVDPVSGNEVPVGSTQEEVRDDIPAQLSEGEFVFPADVVRFIGLDNLMKLRQEAKAGLAKMDRMGQMGNSEEAVEDDTGEFDTDIDDIIGEIEREARMAQPEEEKSEEETPVKKSDEERLGFNIGGLGTKDDSSENKEEEDKKITTAPTTPVAPKADTKDAAMNILGKKYDVSQQPTSKELAQSILEKKYGKGVTAKRIAGIEDIEKSAMGSVKDRSTLESTYTMTKDEYSKLDQAGAQDHIYNQILNQNNVFLADQGVNYQGKQSDKEFIFRHMAKDLAAAGIKDLRQLGSEETPIIENVTLTKKGDKYYRTVEDKSKPLGMGGYGTKQVEVDPADLISEPETKQVTKSLNYAGMTKEVPVTTAKVKVGATTTLVNKETGEKVVQGKYGGNLTEYQKGQGFRWGNTTSVEGMADYMISFDDKGQPLVYPRYEDTTSGFVAPLLKGAMLAATIYGGYTLANTFATKGLAAGAKKVGKKLIQKQVSKALD